MTDAERRREAGRRATSARLAILDVVRAGNGPRTGEMARTARDRAGCEPHISGRHHRLVCRRCGTVANVDCPAGHSPCLEPVTSAGYTIDEAQVTFWGLCARCREPGQPGASPAAGPPG
jgi:Fur family transcriptional regulator, stress-responsive regulator